MKTENGSRKRKETLKYVTEDCLEEWISFCKKSAGFFTIKEEVEKNNCQQL